MNVRPTLPLGYAEPKESKPKLALLDDFDGDPAGFPHGQAVESVLLSHSDVQPSEIQRMQNEPTGADLTKMIKNEKLGFLTAFRAMTARNIASFYDFTTKNLRTVLAEQPSVRVINQSQGETSAHQLEMIWEGLKNNETFRSGVAQSLGLPADAPLKPICEALLNAADHIANRDPFVQGYRKEYLKAARDAYKSGVTYLVAAGNHGPFARELENHGVEASPSAFRNVLVCDYVTVVGADDAQGRESARNSPNAGIEVRALGEDLPWSAGEGFDTSGVHSGTSFATPIVAGRVLGMEPASPFEIESKLMGLDSYLVDHGSRVETANGHELVGDGKLEGYILERIGEGFLHDLAGEDAKQIANANQESTFFGLPGKADYEFQLVRLAPDPDGQRELTIETFFNEGSHVLRARAQDGAWDPATISEELHLDAARQKKIEGA